MIVVLPVAILIGWVVSAIAAALCIWFGVTWYRFRRYHRRKDLPLPDGPTWPDRVRHWWAEAVALVRIHVWRLGRAPVRFRERQDGRPVLCVHGFTQDRTNFVALRRRLFSLGRASVAIDLGVPGRHPRKLASRVIRALEDLAGDEPVDVVCHSMGGLVLRDALAQRPDLAAGIRTIVTLGSPHHGTAGARWPARIWPEAAGLARRSGWIAELPDFQTVAPSARAVTIGGSADYVVYPLDTCHLPGTERIDFHGVGHAGLLTNPEVVDTVVEVLESDDDPARQGPVEATPVAS